MLLAEKCWRILDWGTDFFGGDSVQDDVAVLTAYMVQGPRCEQAIGEGSAPRVAKPSPD